MVTWRYTLAHIRRTKLLHRNMLTVILDRIQEYNMVIQIQNIT